jgi:hypothetical protein
MSLKTEVPRREISELKVQINAFLRIRKGMRAVILAWYRTLALSVQF